MAAADIGHMGAQSGASSADSNKTYGPGEGPGGAHLYPADWYREPGGDEIGPYLRNGVPPGSWATIACKTAPHYRVEDCEELGESPPGSGLSRALRLASWQFQVLPPRINGAAQMGVWVKIHWYWTAPHADADSPPRAVDGN